MFSDDQKKYARASRLQARRSLDIEAALVWAYRDQRVDGGGVSDWVLLAGPVYSGDGCLQVARQAALGCRVDTAGIAALFGGSGSVIHPDAELIGDAVAALAKRDRMAAQLIVSNARVAMQPDYAPENFAVGVDRRGRRFRGGAPGYQGDPLLTREGGAYCEVFIYGGPAATERARKQWQRWRDGLVRLAEALDGGLSTIEITGPKVAAWPWRTQRKRLLAEARLAELIARYRAGAMPRELAVAFGLGVDQVKNLVRGINRVDS